MAASHLDSEDQQNSSSAAAELPRIAEGGFELSELRRRRLFTILLACLSWGAGILSALLHAYAGDVERALFTGSYGLLIMACLFGLRIGRRRPEPVAHAILALTTIGMVASPALSAEALAVPIGLVTIPFSAILALGYRQGAIWTPIAAATLAGFALFGPVGVAERTLIGNAVIVTALIGGVGIFIDRQRSRAQIQADDASASAVAEAESRSQTEAFLAEREALLTTVFGRTPAILILIDLANGAIVEVNDRFSQILGWDRDEAIGQTLSELGAWVDEDDMRRLGRHVVETGGAETLESGLLDRNGNVIDLLASVETLAVDGRPHWLVHAVDIRSRKQDQDRVVGEMRQQLEVQGRELEASLERIGLQDRLLSVGTLAAGIAHQINNPVGGIRMIAELSRTELEEGSSKEADLVSSLDRIVSEAARCGDIVRSILQFSRNEPMSRWAGDLNDVVEQSVQRMRPQVRRLDASIEKRLWHEPLPVAMNPIAIDQILANLIENAALASDEAINAAVTTELRDGFAILTISDDGPGMDEDVLERAFDPFFTTRLDRGGTGLGLSVVHGLVRDLGGNIEIHAGGDSGVRVEIALPLLEDEARRDDRSIDADRTAMPPTGSQVRTERPGSQT